MTERGDHPAHYGGAESRYEHVKVCRAWKLDQLAFLYNCTKYICRAASGKHKKVKQLEDLKKAQWYLSAEIERRETP